MGIIAHLGTDIRRHCVSQSGFQFVPKVFIECSTPISVKHVFMKLVLCTAELSAWNRFGDLSFSEGKYTKTF